MTGTSSRSLYGNANRPQLPVPSHRSNSLRSHQSPYTHNDKDEQLYNLVSDLSNACRKDSNANALKDFNLIETLEKSAKDILARRNNQETSPSKDGTIQPVDLIQKRRRLSIEVKSDEESEISEPRFQKIERSAGDGTTPAPKRYNMPTFFSSMPRQGNTNIPSNRSASPLINKESPFKTNSIPEKKSTSVDFQDFSDPEDEEPSFMRESISRDTFSRETGVYAREALCMDDLSLDEINMIAPGQEEIHRKRSHGDMNITSLSARDDDDIQSIMDQAKGAVDPDYINTNSSTKPMTTKTEKEPEFVYTHLGSKLKSTRSRSGSGSRDRSRRGSDDKKTITESKLISINKTSFAAAQANRANLRSQTMLESKTEWSFKPPSKEVKPPISAAKSTTVRATPSTLSERELRRDVKKPVDTKAVEVKRTVKSPPTPIKREFSLDDTIQDEEPKKNTERVVQPDRVKQDIVSAELLSKIATLEKQLSQKSEECSNLTAELATQDAQWKTQFQASDVAFKALEKSVATLASEKQALAKEVIALEERIPSGDNATNRIVWHLREILREEEADNKIESAKATKISALVSRFEKSNAQVQADFAQQLRHEIKTIGLTRAASRSVDNANTNRNVSELESKIADQELKIESLKREVQNYQNQLEMALQTAMERDHDVVQLEQKLSSMEIVKSTAADPLVLEKTLQLQKSEAKKLEEKIAQLESTIAKRDEEKARLEDQVESLTRSADEKTTVLDLKKQLDLERSEFERQQQAQKAKELPTNRESSILRDSFVRKAVRFEDEDPDVAAQLRTQLKKKDDEIAKMRAALHERLCDVNALKQEVVAKTETIKHLSADFAKHQDSAESDADTEMAKMEMFLFNQVCAKQQEVEDLIMELNRKEDEIKELTEQEAGGADLDLLRAEFSELSSQLKIAIEQNTHLTQETQLQARSIESKQKQIKTLIELMESKELELAELDEALATAEMQVEYLKQQYNVSFTQEEEESFTTAYREGGRRSSISLRRNSTSIPYFKSNDGMDAGYDEYERPESLSAQSGISYMTKDSESCFEDDFAGSPRFSDVPSRDSLVSRSSEWGLEI